MILVVLAIQSGIRQGYPRSPYLFISVMTVMLSDIYDRCSTRINYGKQDGLNCAEVPYADDTLLIFKKTRCMNIMLQEIDTESAYYNMKFNEGQCNIITMNGNFNVNFTDGTGLENVDSTTLSCEAEQQQLQDQTLKSAPESQRQCQCPDRQSYVGRTRNAPSNGKQASTMQSLRQSQFTVSKDCILCILHP